MNTEKIQLQSGVFLKYLLERNCKKDRKNESNGKMVRLLFCRRFIIVSDSFLRIHKNEAAAC